MKKHTLVVIILSIFALALGIWLQQYAKDVAASKSQGSGISGFYWSNGRQLQPFELQDQNAQPFGLAQLQGKWSLMFFGYTHCPDICPTTLNTLKEVKQGLIPHAKDTDNTQYIFVSVDGSRDIPAVLKPYVEYFDPQFIAVSGNDVSLRALTQQLGVVSFKIPNKDHKSTPEDPYGKHYAMDHSSAIMLIDPKGRMVAVMSTPHEAVALVKKYVKMRRYAAEN